MSEQNPSQETVQALTPDNVTNEQRAAIRSMWRARNSESQTPMTDLRGEMRDSGIFGHLVKINNLELRKIAESTDDIDTEAENIDDSTIRALRRRYDRIQDSDPQEAAALLEQIAALEGVRPDITTGEVLVGDQETGSVEAVPSDEEIADNFEGTNEEYVDGVQADNDTKNGVVEMEAEAPSPWVRTVSPAESRYVYSPRSRDEHVRNDSMPEGTLQSASGADIEPDDWPVYTGAGGRADNQGVSEPGLSGEAGASDTLDTLDTPSDEEPQASRAEGLPEQPATDVESPSATEEEGGSENASVEAEDAVESDLPDADNPEHVGVKNEASNHDADEGEAPPEDSASTTDSSENAEEGEEATGLDDPEYQKLVAMLIDTSVDLRATSVDIANKRLTTELAEINGIDPSSGRFKKFIHRISPRRIVRNIWKGTGPFKDYHREKYAREIEDELRVAGNFTGDGLSPDQLAEARRSLFDRFGLDYEEAIHTEAGERRETLRHDSTFVSTSKELIRQYVEQEDFTREALEESINRTIAELASTQEQKFARTELMKVSNLMEIADSVKGMVEHGLSIDRILSEMQFIEGEARTGVRTEVGQTSVGQMFEKIGKSRMRLLKRLTPEAALAISTVAASVSGRVGISVARNAGVASATGTVLAPFALILAPGVIGGALAGAREWRQVGQDRTQHAREMAKGGSDIAAGSKSRTEMEAARYNTHNARDIVDGLDQLAEALSNPENTANRSQLVRDGLSRLSTINTIIKISDKRAIDLIRYDGEASIGDQRLHLDIARARLKVELEASLNGLSDAEKTSLGLIDRSIRDVVNQESEDIVRIIDADVSEKDRAFSAIRRRRVAKQAAVGAVAGATFGLLTQETIAIFNSNVQGVFETANLQEINQLDGHVHKTPLATLFNPETSPLPLHEVSVPGTNTPMAVPAGMGFRDDGNGLFSFVDRDGKVLAGSLEVDPANSRLTPASQDALRATGLGFEEKVYSRSMVPGAPEVVDTTKDVGGYMNDHGAIGVKRIGWADNNTPAPKFDKNELKLWYGGDGPEGDHVDGAGTIKYSISNMRESGSYRGGTYYNFREELRNGTMHAYITGSKGTQNFAFKVPIDTAGNFSIAVDDPAYKLFEVGPDGKFTFRGGFIETAVDRGVNDQGRERIIPLATVVGDNSLDKIGDRIEKPTWKWHIEHTYEITGDAPLFIEATPWVGPPVGRKSLENLSPRIRRESGGYSGASDNRFESQWRRERSPRIRQDPGARLRLGEELGWHREFMRRSGGDSYVSEIDGFVNSAEGLRSLDSRTKAIVTIPVGATQEADNIYRTLSLYGQQQGVDMNSFRVLLHVNWIDSAQNNPEKAAAIAKTHSEIARAKADFPDLRVDTIQSVWSQDKLDRKEYGDRLIGHVSQKMYDTAMMATDRAVRDGRIDGSTSDMLIIKNDADAMGMDKRYIAKMIRSFEDHPESDTFTGAIYWGAERHKDLPGLGFVTKFNEISRIVSQLKSVNSYQNSFGVNTAVRMSAFAAVGGIGHYGDQRESAPDDLAIGERVHAARNATTPGSGPGLYGSSPKKGGSLSYHRHVKGAAIDSDVSRMEAPYIDGRTIIGTWAQATSGSGEMNDRGSANMSAKEDIDKNPDLVINRIEENLSAIMTHWVTDERQIRAALAFMVPDPSHYNISSKDGRTMFKLTKKGRKWLVDSMRRSGKGRGQLDPYGNRTVRRLYGEDKRRHKGIYRSKPHPAPLLKG